MPLLTRAAIGEGQAEWTVHAYLAPEWFRLCAAKPYQRVSNAAWVALPAEATESAAHQSVRRKLSELESYHGIAEADSGPQPLPRVEFLHTEEQTLLRDYAAALSLVESLAEQHGEKTWTSAI